MYFCTNAITVKAVLARTLSVRRTEAGHSCRGSEPQRRSLRSCPPLAPTVNSRDYNNSFGYQWMSGLIGIASKNRRVRSLTRFGDRRQQTNWTRICPCTPARHLRHLARLQPRRIVASALPESAYPPFGEIATENTRPECAQKFRISPPPALSQRLSGMSWRRSEAIP